MTEWTGEHSEIRRRLRDGDSRPQDVIDEVFAEKGRIQRVEPTPVTEPEVTGEAPEPDRAPTREELDSEAQRLLAERGLNKLSIVDSAGLRLEVEVARPERRITRLILEVKPGPQILDIPHGSKVLGVFAIGEFRTSKPALYLDSPVNSPRAEVPFRVLELGATYEHDGFQEFIGAAVMRDGTPLFIYMG